MAVRVGRSITGSGKPHSVREVGRNDFGAAKIRKTAAPAKQNQHETRIQSESVLYQQIWSVGETCDVNQQ